MNDQDFICYGSTLFSNPLTVYSMIKYNNLPALLIHRNMSANIIQFLGNPMFVVCFTYHTKHWISLFHWLWRNGFLYKLFFSSLLFCFYLIFFPSFACNNQLIFYFHFSRWHLKCTHKVIRRSSIRNQCRCLDKFTYSLMVI